MKRSAMGAIVLVLAVAAGASVYGQDANTRGFINDITIAGLTEVQLGKLASERAMNPDVKAFGQMMVRDHTKAAAELKPIAAQLMVQQPTEPDQKHKDLADKLAKLQGSAFDREYMTAMAQGHEEVLAKLRTRVEQHTAPHGEGGVAHPPEPKSTPGTQAGNKPAPHAAASAGEDAGERKLTQWAAMALPTVQKHLDRARELQKTVAE